MCAGGVQRREESRRERERGEGERENERESVREIEKSNLNSK